MSRWKEIWDSRVERLDLIDASDTQSVFAELKRIDGFDLEGGLPISSLLEQYKNMKKELDVHGGGNSVRGGMRSRRQFISVGARWRQSWRTGLFKYAFSNLEEGDGSQAACRMYL